MRRIWRIGFARLSRRMAINAESLKLKAEHASVLQAASVSGSVLPGGGFNKWLSLSLRRALPQPWAGALPTSPSTVTL